MKKFRYKKIRCANPDCEIEFHPNRSNQFHCSEACRLRKNYIENKPETDRIRQQDILFKKADKSLARLDRQMLKMKTDRVSKELFGYENISPDLCNIVRENPDTHRPIHFFYNYGFEFDGDGFYIIHKMKKI
jgi:hypothetical protein